MHRPLLPPRLLRWIRPFLPHLRGEGRALAAAVALVVAVVASNATLIFLAGRPIQALAAGEFEAMPGLVALLAAVVVVNQALHFAATLNANALGLRFVGRVRNRALERLLRAGFPALEGVERGDVLARLSHDVDEVQRLVVEMPLFLLSHALTFLTYAAMLLWLDWALALSALALVPLFALHQALFAGPKRRAAEDFLRANGRLLALEEGAVGNLRGINGLAAEAALAARHREVFERARRAAMRERWLDTGFTSSLVLLVYLGALLVFAWGVARLAEGRLDLGALTSFLLFLGYLSVPVRGLAQLPFQAQAGAGAAERVLALMEVRPVVPEASAAPPLRVTAGAIALRGVRFAYPGGPWVLDGVDLDVAPGETLALVGPSGAGKSTLAQLVARYRDPQDGVVSIDGQDLRAVALASVHEQVAVMWQDPLLLADTVRANLLLARADAGEAELREALEAAGAWDFVRALPQGLDTPVGNGGVGLSTGQVQRLGLARMFLKDPPILVLDEVSANLDSESERRFLAALTRLRRGRTTLLIAHRFATIRAADRVAYLDGGHLTVGTHEELFAWHAGYREAVAWQTAPSRSP